LPPDLPADLPPDLPPDLPSEGAPLAPDGPTSSVFTDDFELGDLSR